MRMSRTIFIGYDELFSLVRDILLKHGLSPHHAVPVARVIADGERDECISHGVYRLPWCIHSLKTQKVSPDAEPVISEDETVIIRTDANRAFNCLAFERSIPFLEKKAKTFGLAALVVNNCFHFSALWPEVEALAERGLAAIAFNPSHAGVAPAGGTKPLLGTNPFAFAWPRPGKNPYVFDFATSAVARGEIELHRIAGKPIPLGWALDSNGQPTSDPAAGLAGAMLTFGGYKGSALSTMIELLGGILINDLTSKRSIEFDEGTGSIPGHGELIIAFSPEVFGGAKTGENFDHAEDFFREFSVQQARLPSERRFQARARSNTHGIALNDQAYAGLQALNV